MKKTAAGFVWLTLIAVFALAAPPETQTDFCRYYGPGFHWFTAKSDANGFTLTGPTVPTLSNTLGRALELGRNRYTDALAKGQLPDKEGYFEVATWLAEQAHAAVVAVGSGPQVGVTASPIPLGNTWRGATPLACLRAFAEDAGLEVAVPEEGLWVIGPKKDVETTAMVVTAYPFDQDQVPLLDGTLRAVLRRLPVRNWQSSMGNEGPVVVSLALGYYRIPEEEGSYIFVVTNSFPGGIPGVTGTGPGGMTFKVTIEGSGQDAVVNCVWGIPGVGELLPAFAEDLDGDGYRDFLFLEDGRHALKPVVGEYNFVLSGKDGRGLVSYHHSGKLAVEKKADGAKEIAVQGLYGTGIDGLDKTVILSYDPEKAKYVPEPEPPATQSGDAEAGEDRRARTSPAEALAARLGGADHVVSYDVTTREAIPSSWDFIDHYKKTGTTLRVQRSLWHLCAWNQGQGGFWESLLEGGIPSPAEVLIKYIPEGYKRAYLKYSKEMAPPGYTVTLPRGLQPSSTE